MTELIDEQESKLFAFRISLESTKPERNNPARTRVLLLYNHSAFYLHALLISRILNEGKLNDISNRVLVH